MKDEIIEEVLDWLESYFTEQGGVLKKSWRLITKENFKIWFK